MLTQQTAAGTPSSTMPLPWATLTSSGQYATSKIWIYFWKPSHLHAHLYCYHSNADMEAAGWNDCRPLHRAIAEGNISVLQVLLQNGAQVNGLDIMRYIHVYTDTHTCRTVARANDTFSSLSLSLSLSAPSPRPLDAPRYTFRLGSLSWMSAPSL